MTPAAQRPLPPRLLQYNHPNTPGLVIDTNPDRLNVDVIHTYLATESYWSQGVPRDIVERAIQGSLVWGIYDGDSQVGYARAVTDRVTFAWLCDVFVLPSHQGKGLGKWLIQTVQSHPDLQGLRRFMLGTKDAHGLYAQFGFVPFANPQRFMEINRPNIYQEQSGF